MFKLLINLFITTGISSEINNHMLGNPIQIPGSQGSDQNGCVIDGGYSWCESSQKCTRPWEEPCPSLTDFCDDSNIQMCRAICPDPQCGTNQCAMRINNCCDFTCIDVGTTIAINNCDEVCPPAYPCPMPLVQPGCRVSPPTYDSCGCSSGCGSIDCSTLHTVVGEGGSCGGFMMNEINSCDKDLECVNTMGPMIADAPGTCLPICNTRRDQYGNCLVTNAIDNIEIPWNCASWFDGCNTCSVANGRLGACTLMMCFTNNEPYCLTYYSGKLRMNDLCYRFCEDNSKTLIDRQMDCPPNSGCVSENNMISFDSCSTTMRCIPTNGH